ncbi:anthrone oxygenase family protein [Nodosilinea nodulosa]|uniref:anthrone oxygenase family protein n=1 Tax=Nodosilinea nodulosa TaxID=416001 RepID=UPI000315F814|nr:anthrone oxygenase family protein [Nodosilinea nodulosa]
MGLEFAHALEMPAKLQYDGALYITLQNSLYRYFGAPGPGAFVTVGAVLAAIALAVLVRKHREPFRWTLTGALCLLIAFPLTFFLQIEPVNVVIEQANPEAVPANWEQLRHQWEFAHAINFLFTLAGFSALLMSVLVNPPFPPLPAYPGAKS